MNIADLGTPERHEDGRSIDYRWVIDERDDVQLLAELSVYHSKSYGPGKYARHLMTVQTNGKWERRSFSLRGDAPRPVLLGEQPAPRYSAKALAAYAEQVLASLDLSDPGTAAVFSERLAEEA